MLSMPLSVAAGTHERNLIVSTQRSWVRFDPHPIPLSVVLDRVTSKSGLPNRTQRSWVRWVLLGAVLMMVF